MRGIPDHSMYGQVCLAEVSRVLCESKLEGPLAVLPLNPIGRRMPMVGRRRKQQECGGAIRAPIGLGPTGGKRNRLRMYTGDTGGDDQWVTKG